MQTPKDIHALLAAVDRDASSILTPAAALVTLMRTRGSSFRRPGSRMLVGGGGEVIRGLSGGCPEADIAARAALVIRSRIAEVVRYGRDYGFDALLELGCGGGELEVLIEPIHARDDLAFLDLLAHAGRERRRGFLATAVSGTGSALRAHRVLVLDGALRLSTFAEADATARIVAAAPTLAGRASSFEPVALADGEAGVLFEAITPPIRLLLVGHDRVTDQVESWAGELGWSVARFAARGEAAAIARALAADPLHPFDERSFALVMTYNLEKDIELAAQLLATSVRYVGLLGSRQRSATVRARLAERCGAKAVASRVFSPAGLDLGSEDPEEIALSLLAEVRAVAADKPGGRLSASLGPIHGTGQDAVLPGPAAATVGERRRTG